MTPAATVVVAGGYGSVGARLTAELAPGLPGAVLVAGRSHELALAAAATIGHGTRAARLDVLDPGAVCALLDAERPRVVVASVARGGARLAEACLTRGVHVVDVTAEADEIGATERLSAAAVRHRATAVLSVGLTPGLTNLLAHRACSSLEHVDRLDLAVRLGVGDAHGPAALTWTLENLGGRYEAPERGATRELRAFAHRRRIAFDPGVRAGALSATFNFPEQRTLARTLGVPTVRSWLALDPPAVHVLAVVAARTGLAARIAGPLARAVGSPLLSHLPGDDTWSAWVQATGRRNGRVEQTTLTRRGAREAAVTAGVAAEVVWRLLAGGERPGVSHVEQLRDPAGMLDAIDATLSGPVHVRRSGRRVR